MGSSTPIMILMMVVTLVCAAIIVTAAAGALLPLLPSSSVFAQQEETSLGEREEDRGSGIASDVLDSVGVEDEEEEENDGAATATGDDGDTNTQIAVPITDQDQGAANLGANLAANLDIEHIIEEAPPTPPEEEEPPEEDEFIGTISGQGDAEGNDLGLLCKNSDGTRQFFWSGFNVNLDFDAQIKTPKKTTGSWQIINHTQFGEEGTKSGLITSATVNNRDGSFALTGIENANTLCVTPFPTTITITGQCKPDEQFIRFESADGREVGTFSGTVSCQEQI